MRTAEGATGGSPSLKSAPHEQPSALADHVQPGRQLMQKILCRSSQLDRFFSRPRFVVRNAARPTMMRGAACMEKLLEEDASPVMDRLHFKEDHQWTMA